MTTKQPPAQKHLEMAREIHRSWIYSKMDGNDLIGLIETALAETEAAALAGRIAGPSDEEIEAFLKTQFTRHYEDGTSYYAKGEAGNRKFYIEWYRSQLKLTHESAPEIRVPKKRDWESKVEDSFTTAHKKGWNYAIEEVRRLNPTARIEDVDE